MIPDRDKGMGKFRGDCYNKYGVNGIVYTLAREVRSWQGQVIGVSRDMPMKSGI